MVKQLITIICTLAALFAVLTPLFFYFSPRTNSGEATEGEEQITYVRLHPMLLPTDNKSNAVITIYMKTVHSKHYSDICYAAPRIRDQVLRSISNKPIPISSGKILLTNIPQQILAPINEAIGENYVQLVQVFVEGMSNYSHGGAQSISEEKLQTQNVVKVCSRY